MFKNSEEDRKAIKEVEEQILKDENERERKTEEVLEAVRKQVSKEMFECIEFEISESGYTDNFRIIDAPIGKLQQTEDIKVWVDQYSVGASGDSWCGTVCVKLPDGKYLAWGYSI